MGWFGGKQHRVGRRVHIDKISESARDILLGAGFIFEPDVSQADSLWVRKNPQKYLPALGAHQLINHLPEEREIINKASLATHLREYQRSCVPGEVDLSQITQETYCLEVGGSTADVS